MRLRKRSSPLSPGRTNTGTNTPERESTPAPAPTNDAITDIWKSALDQYRDAVGFNLQNKKDELVRRMEKCTTTDAILRVLDDAAHYLVDQRRGNRKLEAVRGFLKPVVVGLDTILDAGAETGSALGVPGGKGIFAAVAVLLKAADRVSATFDDMEQLFERLQVYIERLEVRIKAPLRDQAKTIAVKALAEMLKAFAIATKMMRQNRLGMFVRALFTKGDYVQHAIRVLEKNMSDSIRMDIVDVVVGMHELSSDVLQIKTSMSQFLEMMQPLLEGIQPVVEQTHAMMGTVLSESRERDALLWTMATELRVACRAFQRHEEDKKRYEAAVTAEEQSARPELRWRRWGGQLYCVVCRFSPRDQDSVWRTLVGLLLACVECTMGFSTRRSLQQADSDDDAGQVVVRFLWTTCAFLLLFMMQKLDTVTRSLGKAPGVINIVDIMGFSLVLEQDDFASWEATHSFLLRVFSSSRDRRHGLSIVENREYGLGNNDLLVITAEQWSHIVRPGAILHMCILLHTTDLSCPYCGLEASSEETLSDGRIICSNPECGRTYGAHQDDSNLSDPETSDLSTSHSFTAVSGNTAGKLIRAFTRVVVLIWECYLSYDDEDESSGASGMPWDIRSGLDLPPLAHLMPPGIPYMITNTARTFPELTYYGVHTPVRPPAPCCVYSGERGGLPGACATLLPPYAILPGYGERSSLIPVHLADPLRHRYHELERQRGGFIEMPQRTDRLLD
ncbi:unnamed protein product [Peniophora sp. CBMAI 1063]|nr:unnamed protein product [Peniophora sp. CBMAI 1063]